MRVGAGERGEPRGQRADRAVPRRHREPWRGTAAPRVGGEQPGVQQRRLAGAGRADHDQRAGVRAVAGKPGEQVPHGLLAAEEPVAVAGCRSSAVPGTGSGRRARRCRRGPRRGRVAAPAERREQLDEVGLVGVAAGGQLLRHRGRRLRGDGRRGRHQLAGARVAPLRVLVHAGAHDQVDAPAGCAVEQRRRGRRVVELRRELADGVLRGERNPAGEALEQHARQGVHVGRGVDVAAHQAFRRHVVEGADVVTRAGQLGDVRRERAGDAEVGEVGDAGLRRAGCWPA